MDQYYEKQTKWVLKVIWPWQDEKEEKWLEQQALEGWHLISVAPFFYQFQKGNPRLVTYRLDYKVMSDKDFKEYQELFHDSGWELAATLSNWHYYRIEPGNDQAPEIYNSNRAKAQKYRRLLAGLFPILFIFITIFIPRITDLVDGKEGVSVFYRIAYLFAIAIMLFMAYATIRIVVKISRLESESKE
ncbi:MAG: DUF2812 domain-containing protein [Anaerolineaceae bacterium]|nr:DUF2812 domain-containing protein [Anaerolineaceae bacterium]